MVTAADRGLPPPLTGGEPPNGVRHAATTGVRRHDAPPARGTHAPLAAAPGTHRRRPTDTHVSQEQRDAAHDRDRAPMLRREALVPANDTLGAAPHAPRGPRNWDGRLFCGHDAMIPFTATCAACFLWREFGNTLLPCGHDPSDPSPSRGATCAGSTSRIWTSAMGVRAGWPAGSPRPAPSCGDRARTAFAPATRTGRTTFSSAGTRWTARAATARRARHAGTCTARRAGCT